jgi:NifU-like protein involved in Fe-S cluster formation
VRQRLLLNQQKHKNQKTEKQIKNKKKLKKHSREWSGPKKFFFLCIYAIAGVSSPNCGDKVEVQLLFMAFKYLAIYI